MLRSTRKSAQQRINRAVMETIEPRTLLSVYFEEPESYATAGPSADIAVGDFNNDCVQDLATTDSLNNSVGVLTGNEDGTFNSFDSFDVSSIPAAVPIGIIAVDVDNNGNMDLVTANILHNSFSVLRGNGNGTFQAPQEYFLNIFQSGLSAVELDAADVNGDCYPDLVVSDAITPIVNVLYNNGSGGFDFSQAYFSTAPTSPAAVCLDVHFADVNCDGAQDIVCSNLLSLTLGNISVLRGYGDGTFQTALSAATLPGILPVGLDVGEFTGDKKPDVVVATVLALPVEKNLDLDGSVTLLQNLGNGTFKVRTSVRAEGPCVDVTVADFNGDCNNDVAVSLPGFPFSAVAVLEGNGKGSLKAFNDNPSSVNFNTFEYEPANEFSVALGIRNGDFNGDGRPDIAVADGATVFLNESFDTIKCQGKVIKNVCVEGKKQKDICVATFTDTFVPTDPDDYYCVNIDWGDGTCSEGEVECTGGNNFKVLGDHTYIEEGTYAVKVEIYRDYEYAYEEYQPGFCSSQIVVGDAGLKVACNDALKLGKSLTIKDGVLGSFWDENPFGNASDFKASILWGDGKSSAASIIELDDGSFGVVGSHKYSSAKNYTLNIVVNDIGGATLKFAVALKYDKNCNSCNGH